MADLATEVGQDRRAPEELLDRLVARVPDDERSLACAFAEATLRRVPAELLRSADLDHLADVIADAYRFLAEDPAGGIAIRIVDAPGTGPGTAVEVTTEDRPFLLSTIMAELRHRGLGVVRSIHPVVGVQRDEDGVLRRIIPARRAERRESLVHVELDRHLDDEERADLERTLRAHLRDVVAATDDHPQMRAAIERAIERIESAERPTDEQAAAADDVDRRPERDAAEVAALLRWLLADTFLVLGTRRYEVTEQEGGTAVVVDHRSGRGVLRDSSTSAYREPVAVEDADAGFRERLADETLVTFSRSHRVSTVHQRDRMLNIWVDERRDGRISGQLRITGLFTRKAYAEPSSTVPLLRAKLRRILELEDIVAESHDERALIALFEAVPKEEAFSLGVEALREALIRLFAASERGEVDVLTRPDPLTRNVSVIVSVPRDRYDARLRRRIQQLLLDRYGGSRVDVDLSLGDRPDAVVRFAVQVPDGDIPEVADEELEEAIRRLARSWVDDLGAALVARHGEAEGRRLLREVGERLPPAYRDATPVDRAADDVEVLDALGDGAIDVRIEPGRRGLLRVRLLIRGTGVELSSILPVLESLGLTVVEELPFRLRGEGPELHLHDYGVRPGDVDVDVATDGERIAEAVTAAWQGRLEVDSLNRVVLRAGLDWTWVTVLRAYRRYRRQVGTAYTAEYQNDALANNPEAVRALVELFDARFDPARAASEGEIAQLRERVVEACDAVERLDEDRILRDLLALVDATSRTNRYRQPRPSELALKIDSTAVPQVPRPVPHREVFVYSPDIEGVHLRGGEIARGGIRWSDRRDDFRSEVADLMQAQMLKNALIVPDGAKGGYVLKRPPADRSALATASRDAYRRFIGALLEITDDVDGDEVVPPAAIVRRDGDDPYLVVAPDRGTATFSDLANELASERGFWLGDAFASGGSSGYDHKQLGITARGAWVAVRRHFRELGLDVDHDPIRVVGIGDMSGDVFGNAMLCSHTIRLVAAFDHRDIFIDPDPDPERSYEERRRLFEHGRLTWQDHDRSVLSEGGGVWSRRQKTIELTPAARELLRADDERLSPPELVRALLRAPVDLLFAGGIGTFVRATDETDEEIGDRANDEVRVEATELRARVVGEGANLALTHRARIQYARRGGKVNADFVDNAAGVDISDHEVNIKILLRRAVERGELAAEQRDALLAEVTDDVVASCLDDVDRQTWVLTQETATSAERVGAHGALIDRLERRGRLDREVEALPSAEEVEERAEVGAGLTRPELAVLLGATKRDLSVQLTASSLVGEEVLRPLLTGYFPPRLAERFGELLDGHRLRSQLVATELANEVVDRMGITFVDRLARELGIGEVEVVRAWWAARQVADGPHYWRTLGRLEDVADPEAVIAAKRPVDHLLETLTRAYLRSGEHRDLDATIGRDRRAWQAVLDELSTGPTPSDVARSAESLLDAGLEPDEAVLLASAERLGTTPDVGRVGRRVGRDAAAVASAFLALDEELGLGRLRRLLDGLQPADRWERWQHGGLVDDLRDAHRTAVHAALADNPEQDEHTAVARFVERRAAAISHAVSLAREVEQDEGAPRAEAVSVAVRALRDAVGPRR